MAQPINYLSSLGVLPDPVGAINQSLMMDSRLRAAKQAEQLGALQIQQAAQEMGQVSAFRQDVDNLLTNPTPEAYSALFAKYPSFQKSLSASWETRDRAARDNDLREMASIYAAGEAGNWDVVARNLRRRIDADKAAGQDVTEDEEALRIAESGSPEEKRALLGMTGVSLAATLGPDKFTEAYKTLNPNQTREGKVVGQSLVDPVTGEVIYQAPTDPKYMNIDGNLVEIPGAAGMARGGDVDDIFSRIIQQESGGQQFGADGKPLRSPKGAVGIAQVMPKTGPEAAQLAGLPWDVKRFHTDPEYNGALGRAYFSKQLSDFGDPALAAAAYNAGPGRVKAAVKKGGVDGWVDHLPKETRDYVANVVPARSGGVPRVLFSAPKESFSTLTPAEVEAAGLPDGTVAQRGPDGRINVVAKAGEGKDAPYSQSALDAFDRAIGTAQRLLEHPGFEAAVGAKNIFTGNPFGEWAVPGTNRADFNAELEALKAQVFLPMVQSMKGMGALSNAEGEKLTAAIGALSTQQSEGQFKKSLQRVIDDLKVYRDRGSEKAPKAPMTALPAGWSVRVK